MSFFGGIFKGVIVTILGTLVVYIIFFIIMAPKLPKNIAGLRAFVSSMVNVKETIGNMQSKSSAYLDKKDTKLALEGDSLTPEEFAKAVAEQNLVEALADDAPTPRGDKRLARMQAQLDRIENQNRQLSLRLQKLEKNTTTDLKE